MGEGDRPCSVPSRNERSTCCIKNEHPSRWRPTARGDSRGKMRAVKLRAELVRRDPEGAVALQKIEILAAPFREKKQVRVEKREEKKRREERHRMSDPGSRDQLLQSERMRLRAELAR
eukprot:748830-Rhodomonas_salina.1